MSSFGGYILLAEIKLGTVKYNVNESVSYTVPFTSFLKANIA